MTEQKTYLGPYIIDRRIHTSEDRSLFYAPQPKGTRIPLDAAVYCLHHTHRQTQHVLALEDDFNLLKQLQHPAFPKAIQLYQRQFGFAREWIHGASLREMLVMVHQSKTLLPQDTIYDIMESIIEGYMVLYNLPTPLLHGRLNWDHVLFGVDGRVVIIGLRAHNKTNLYSFSSREQATDKFFDERSDQWSIGAIFASLLLKESLYTGRPNPEYDASKGDVTHWLDRIKVSYPHAYPVVARMLQPAAGERYRHPSFMAREIAALRERFPNTQRLELGEALKDWLDRRDRQPSQSTDTIIPPTLPSPVLPRRGPELHNHVLEVTENIEPELDDLIEVTQFNVPQVNTISVASLTTESLPEPLFIPPVAPPVQPKPVVIEIDDAEEDSDITERIDETQPAQPPTTKPPPIAKESVTPNKDLNLAERSVSEPSLSEPSLAPHVLFEASFAEDMFTAQKRATILMIINGLALLIFIWRVLL